MKINYGLAMFLILIVGINICYTILSWQDLQNMRKAHPELGSWPIIGWAVILITIFCAVSLTGYVYFEKGVLTW